VVNITSEALQLRPCESDSYSDYDC